MKIGSVRKPQTTFQYTLSGRQDGESILVKAKAMLPNGQLPDSGAPFVGTFTSSATQVPDDKGILVDGWLLTLDVTGLSVGDYVFNEVINGVTVEEPVVFSILSAITQ